MRVDSELNSSRGTHCTSDKDRPLVYDELVLPRIDRTCAALLLALTALCAAPQLHGPIDARADGAVYYILGTSLAQGHGYRLLNEPGDIKAVQYPPLLPLAVAAHQRALGTSDFVVVGRWLRGSFFIVLLALAGATYMLARQFLAPRRALLAGAVSSASLSVWYFAGALYTEVPYGLLAVLFVICARKASQTKYWVATAAIGAAAYLLRTAGIALLGAWILDALFHQAAEPSVASRWPSGQRLTQAAARAAVALLPVLAWQAYVSSVTSDPAYTQQQAYSYQRAPYQYSNVPYLQNLELVNPFVPEQGHMTAAKWASRISWNLVPVIPALGGAVTAQDGFWKLTLDTVNRLVRRDVLPASASVVPMAGLGLLVIGGALVMVRQREWLVPFICAATTALMCLTPWSEQFVRYFAPIIPFLSIMVVMCLGAVVDRADIRGAGWWARRAFAVGVVALIFTQDVFVAVWTFKSQRPKIYADAAGRQTEWLLSYYDERATAVDEALQQVRHRAKPGDVMATTMPHWAYLQTGVKSILPPLVSDHDEARRLLDAVPVRFVVLDEQAYLLFSQRYAAPAVQDAPLAWQQVYRTANGLASVYERVP